MKKSILIALIICIAAVLWMASGMTKGDADKETAQTSEKNSEQNSTENAKSEIAEVRVQNLTAQVMDDEVEVTGRTQASRQVIIRAETQGQVASLKIKKGDMVKQGQVLAQLEARDRNAKLSEAQQILKQRDIEYQASKELAEKGYNSRVRLAEKEAELQTARAQLKQVQDELSNIVIKAPFGGIINGQMIEIGDYVSTGDELFEIVDLNPVEITGFLTEKQIGSLKEGDTASAVLLNSQVVQGKVTFVAAAADKETRTFAMELTVDNADQAIKEGQTAKILVSFKEDKAYKISPSILSLDDDGTIGVKIVNANSQVEFIPVTLLKDTPDYLWVSGLPDTVQLITVGQAFVVPGQTVKTVLSEGNDLL